jgi:hypothetical protein
MNIYTRDDRIVDEGREIETAVERSTAVIG